MNNMLNTKLLMTSIAAILVIGFSTPAFAAEDSLDHTGAPAIPEEFGTSDGTWYIQEWDGQVPWFEHPFPGALPTLTPPFQFDCGLASCTLTVTDDGNFNNDQFDVFSNSVLLGTTSAPINPGFIGGCVNAGGPFNDPDACVADPVYSSGAFCLGPGVNSIKIINIMAQAGQVSDGWLKASVDTTRQCGPVGGESLQIDSAALLLAGAQTNAVWIMSALAVIGSVAFGALYITSKKN